MPGGAGAGWVGAWDVGIAAGEEARMVGASEETPGGTDGAAAGGRWAGGTGEANCAVLWVGAGGALEVPGAPGAETRIVSA